MEQHQHRSMADATEGEDDVAACLTAALASSGDGMASLISSLPLETRCPPLPLRQLGGFWLPEMILPGAAAAHARFAPRPDDVFLASFPKSGTTWLKALAFAALHPLRLRSPHDCVSFFELPFALAEAGSGGGGADLFEALPSPRVLATHLPYHLLPRRITAAETSGSGSGSGSRIVYVCRDHKDALVSAWLFTKKNLAAAAAAKAAPPPAYPLEEAFELFCAGRCVGGPQWLHVLGYWEASRRRPGKVLFLVYEEMLRDPAGGVRRLAEFLGRPFSAEEEASGAVDAVVELCSLESLRGSKGSRSGVREAFGVENGAFFRKGVAGDWRNHLTPEMAARLDGVVHSALQGSGLELLGVAPAAAGDDDSA